MRYTLFGGRTGLRVSELALGTGNFGTVWPGGTPRDEARQIFDAYRDRGGNFIDSANFYQLGEAEETLADLIRADRDELVVATKWGLGSAGFNGSAGSGNGRKAMVRAVEESLRRLGTDRIDLYWAHMPDGVTPLEETLRGFDDLVRAGKILHCGLSNFPAWRVSRGALLADVRGWAPLVAVQMEYNLVERSAEREVLPMAEALGLAFAAYSPLAQGMLSGKHRLNQAGVANGVRAVSRSEASPRDTAILDALFAIAEEIGTQPAQVAVAWLRGRAVRSAATIVPIIGPRTFPQLGPALEALDLDLDDAQMMRLDEASAWAKGAPHEMIDHPSSKAKLFGDAATRFDRVDRPVA